MDKLIARFRPIQAPAWVAMVGVASLWLAGCAVPVAPVRPVRPVAAIDAPVAVKPASHRLATPTMATHAGA